MGGVAKPFLKLVAASRQSATIQQLPDKMCGLSQIPIMAERFKQARQYFHSPVCRYGLSFSFNVSRPR